MICIYMYINESICTHICIQRSIFEIYEWWLLSLYPLVISCNTCFNKMKISLLEQKYLLNISEYSQETFRWLLKWNRYMICFCTVKNSQWLCVVLQCPDLQGSTPFWFYCCHVSSKHSVFVHMWHFSVHCLNKNSSI